MGLCCRLDSPSPLPRSWTHGGLLAAFPAPSLWRDPRHGTFFVGDKSPRKADYSVASGIFNVRLDHPLDRWEGFVARTLTDMRAASRRGFAVNFMAPEPFAGAAPQSRVYRTAPDPWVRFCKTALGSSVEVLGDYGLREFTLLIRPSGGASEARLRTG